jgi:tRNA pseudouridine55 synthase
VGHTGTLDPMARGVLPICVGKATRIIEFMDADGSADAKAYDCEMRLGVTTDTLDIWGNVVSQTPADSFRRIDADEVEDALAAMVGDIEQIPPAYSAIKYKGKKLYELARRGAEIPDDAVKPRSVSVAGIKLLALEFDGAAADMAASGNAAPDTASPEMVAPGMVPSGGGVAIRLPGFATVRFSVSCSKGTYVRSIVRDVGDALGCGAAMSALTRTKSGVFTLGDAYALPTRECAEDENPCHYRNLLRGTIAPENIFDALLPMDSAIPSMPSITLANAEARSFKAGMRFRVAQNQAGQGGDVRAAGEGQDRASAAAGFRAEFTRVYAGGEFIGIAKIEGGIVKPYKVIA